MVKSFITFGTRDNVRYIIRFFFVTDGGAKRLECLSLAIFKASLIFTNTAAYASRSVYGATLQLALITSVRLA